MGLLATEPPPGTMRWNAAAASTAATDAATAATNTASAATDVAAAATAMDTGGGVGGSGGGGGGGGGGSGGGNAFARMMGAAVTPPPTTAAATPAAAAGAHVWHALDNSLLARTDPGCLPNTHIAAFDFDGTLQTTRSGVKYYLAKGLSDFIMWSPEAGSG